MSEPGQQVCLRETPRIPAGNLQRPSFVDGGCDQTGDCRRRPGLIRMHAECSPASVAATLTSLRCRAVARLASRLLRRSAASRSLPTGPRVAGFSHRRAWYQRRTPATDDTASTARSACWSSTAASGGASAPPLLAQAARDAAPGAFTALVLDGASRQPGAWRTMVNAAGLRARVTPGTALTMAVIPLCSGTPRGRHRQHLDQPPRARLHSAGSSANNGLALSP